MSKRKTLLSLFSLISILGLGLVSCNNEVPIKGDQGEQGPIGPAGENGNDGKDGSIIHTGQGKPSNTLGKDTDLYIDSNTGDLYTKENGSWSLTMNIKGEDGKDGQYGQNGSNGSSGSNGNTAWSNTILPSKDGYITVSSGSNYVGDDVTFTFTPNDSSIISSLTTDNVVWKVNNEEYSESSQNPLSITLQMQKGGYVVSCELASINSVSTEKELLNSLSNLNDGLNIIELDDDITIKGTDLEEIEDTNKSGISLFSNSISKFKNSNEENFENKIEYGYFNLGINPEAEVVIKGKGNQINRTLAFPMLFIDGMVKSLTFQNLNLVVTFNYGNISTDVVNEFNFFNCEYVENLHFKNINFKISWDYAKNNWPLQRMYFLNSLYTLSIEIDNFKGDKASANLFGNFIDSNKCPFINNIDVKNTEIYCSTFIKYNPQDYYCNLDVNVKNTDIYIVTNLYGIRSIFSSNIGNMPKDSTEKYRLNLNIEESSVNQYWDETFTGYQMGGMTNKVISFINGGMLDHAIRKNPDLAFVKDDDFLTFEPSDYYYMDCSEVFINLKNFTVYGNKLKSTEGFESIAYPIVKTKMGNFDDSRYPKCGNVYYWMENMFEYATGRLKPSLIHLGTNLTIVCPECNENEDLYWANERKLDLYPHLTINGKEISPQDYVLLGE